MTAPHQPPAEMRDLLREQREYYAARAPEYDDGYRRRGQHDRGDEENAGWNRELTRLVHAFDAVPIAGDVVELAAGTGFWTERLVGRARTLRVIDGSAETLAVNRERLGPAAAHVDYEVADLFEWQPPRTWDACVCCFFLCHVPDVCMPGFLSTVAAALRPGGVVCFVDKAASSSAAADPVERTINDGRRFTIIDQPRTPDEWVACFGTAGFHIEVDTIGSRFCLGRGTRR